MRKIHTKNTLLFATLAERLQHKKLSSLPWFSKSHSYTIGLYKQCLNHFPQHISQIQKKHFKVLTDIAKLLAYFFLLYSLVPWTKTTTVMQLSVLWMPSPFWTGRRHFMTPRYASLANCVSPTPQNLARMTQNISGQQSLNYSIKESLWNKLSL